MYSNFGDILISGFPSLSLGASLNGNGLNIKNSAGFSIFIKNSGGSAAGTWKLQASLDNINWKDIAGASQAVAGATDMLLNVPDAYYSYVRPVFTYTSGTGTITAALFQSKGA